MKSSRLRKFLDWRSGGDPALNGFDPAFYRAAHKDLPAKLSARQALAHYLSHGQAEGRAANPAEHLAQLVAKHGALPDGFDAKAYGRLNPDLAATHPNDWDLIGHYLEFGCKEYREYRHLDLDLYKALNRLDSLHARADLLAHYDANAGKAGVFTSGADFMAHRGVDGGGRWLEAINLEEFRILNWNWLQGPVADKVDAADTMLAAGVERMAGLSFEVQFDPAYYREAAPQFAALDDRALYRRWLFVGLETWEAGSAQSRLKQLGLDLGDFPSGFDWQAYARKAKGAGSGRWAALEHYVRKGIGVVPPVTTQAPGEFLIAASKAFAVRDDATAIKLVQEAEKYGPLPISEMQGHADSCLRRGAFAKAADLYLKVMDTEAANIWTFANGLQALLALGDLTRATMLLRGAERFRGNAQFRAGVSKLTAGLFRKAEGLAKAAYADGRRAEADRILMDAVDEIDALWRALDPIGAVLRAPSQQRVVMLANTDLRQCTHYRVEQKVEIFKEAKIDFEVFSASKVEEFLNALPGASAAIFYRLAALPEVVRAIEAARSMGIPTYYEIDDLIFDQVYPDPIESYAGAISKADYDGLQFGVPLFRAAMARCDYGVASTPALAKAISPIVRSGKTFVLPNGLDSRNKAWLKRTGRVRRDDDLMIFYGSGTKAHSAEFWELAADAICDVLERHPSATLVVAGFLPLDDRLKALGRRVVQIPFIPDIQSYWAILAESDINLAVLKPGPTTNGKSEIKWLEAAAASVPSIVSDTEAYRDALVDDVDVLFASTPDDWKRQLTRLAGDAALRKSIAAAAKRKALAEFSLKANALRLRDLLAASRPIAAPTLIAPRRRVLLVNTFFPPQTIGGATRVVRNNLDDFLAVWDEHDFEFAVVASDHADDREGWMRVEAYGGAPIFRIGTPAELNMDWRPSNPCVGDAFGRTLDILEPALVHFHATQRLTASTVEQCLQRKIPYVITAHEAWWISDYQFLTNARAEIVDPDNIFDGSPPDGVTVGESLIRRSYLRRLLVQAKGVFGVSHGFTELYRRAGVDALAVPNGAPPMRLAPRPPHDRPPVRLAHVGGKSFHKGYSLVEAALRQGRFANLELTVVDHSRSGGYDRTEVWGRTTVRFVGMTPQESMPEFYAEQDVLLAPSVWPESFGLVAREALQAGLWVVASDRGAMGEDVVEGVNGHIVDVSSPQGVFDALSMIDADWRRYKSAPPPTVLRLASDQAKDLLSIYEKVLGQGAEPVELERRSRF